MSNEQEVFDALKHRIEIDAYGTRRYFNGAHELHRTGGPAIERADGTKYWYQNGLRHRTDGPAVEWCDGVKWWYLNDRPLTEDEFNQEVKHYE